MASVVSWHAGCFACGVENERGLHVLCSPSGPGRVAGKFRAETWMQGYADRLQGGIIAAVLDSAMTQCVKADGSEAVTGSLRIRFTRPARIGSEFEVCAWIRNRRHGAWTVRADLREGGGRVAWAEGVFVDIRHPRPAITA